MGTAVGGSMSLPQAKGSDANPEALSAIVKASETFSIIASHDIVDVRGMKLWAKGQPVSQALQQRLLERKLMQPLEVCLAAEDGATLFRLHDDLNALLGSDTPMALALRPWAQVLLGQVKQLPLHSVAQLLLTAALATRPQTLPHAVLGMALAGAMMARQQPSSAKDIRMAMLGGLLHDIGEVYIQPQYLGGDSALDLIGHKHMVVHPRVAQMLLHDTTDYPQLLCRAIGEHHERLDGSGYPARLLAPDISPLGRLLAVVEVVLGVLQARRAPITHASFALRVVPGEFDPQWIGLICDTARSVAEGLPSRADSDDTMSPMARIDQRLQQAHQLALSLKGLGRSEAMLAVVDNALQRLGRLRVAWNALGAWGAEACTLGRSEQHELELAGHELQSRLRALQRECLLLGDRLVEAERDELQPLWQGLLTE